MSAMDFIVALILAGLRGLVDYLSYHVLLCLIPAFFIAGAISALFRKETITRYLGADTSPFISYPMAAAGGLLLAVCSCTILPLFSSIWKKGAGLGPAVTFLFTGPAINLLAIVLTWQIIGWDIGLSRAILAVLFGIVIGVMMGLIFQRNKEASAGYSPFKVGEDVSNSPRVIGLFILLVGILIAGTFPFTTIMGGDQRVAFFVFNLPSALLLGGLSAHWAVRKNSKDENAAWMSETWFFFKTIMPLLLAGVIIAGILKFLIPESVVGRYVGDDSFSSVTIAVMFGLFMYFPTLVEVPIARLMLDLGMSRAALLAYLLAAPGLSIQSMLVIRKVIGNLKTLVYVSLVAILCIIAGLVYGLAWG